VIYRTVGSLSADGSVVAIGASSNAGVNGAFSGHTRVFFYTFFHHNGNRIVPYPKTEVCMKPWTVVLRVHPLAMWSLISQVTTQIEAGLLLLNSPSLLPME